MTTKEKEANWKAISERTFLAFVDPTLNILHTHIDELNDGIILESSSDNAVPVRNGVISRLYSGGWKSAVSERKHVTSLKKKYAIGFIAGVLIISGSVSAFAESALPGDILYPIKTEVNEKVQVALARTPEDALTVEALLATNRLEEMEQLAMEGRLDPALEQAANDSFKAHVQRFEAHALLIKNMRGKQITKNVIDSLQTRIGVHTALLQDIKINRTILDLGSGTTSKQLAKKKNGSKAMIGNITDSKIATHLDADASRVPLPLVLHTEHQEALDVHASGTIHFVIGTSSSGTPVMVGINTNKAKQYFKKLHKTIGTPSPIIGGAPSNTVIPTYVP